MTEITKLDLYELLDVSRDAGTNDIKKAYRKKALQCHPDKNPDNPKAAELFRQLSKALEILTDESAKFAYDRVLRARNASVARNRVLDSKRKKLKDELEARERAAKDDVINEIDAAKKLEMEIERLRKEGSKQVQMENEIIKKHIRDELNMMRNDNYGKNDDNGHFRIKVKTKSKKRELNESDLRKYFCIYGNINCVVISKRNNSAIIEFDNFNGPMKLEENDFYKIELLNECPSSKSSSGSSKSSHETSQQKIPNLSNVSKIFVENDGDYESVVLRNLRIAEERKRLIQQMQNEDNLKI